MRTRTVLVVAAGVLVVGGGGWIVGDQLSTDDRRPESFSSLPTDTPQTGSSTADSRGALDPAAQRYLDAVADRDADAVAAAFTPDGLVVDVGREIRGRAAIRQWAANEVIGGVYTLLDHIPRASGVTLLVRFQPGGVGGFRANYHFDITDGLITKATLEYA
jgi:hypothetical protein